MNKDLWDEVEREVMSGGQTMLLGDMNAETREAMDRTPGRATTPQDRRLWEMMTRAGGRGKRWGRGRRAGGAW